MEREHNDRAWMTWHIAALQRVKRIPPLRKLQVRPRRSLRKQSPAEHLAAVKAWVATNNIKVIKQASA